MLSFFDAGVVVFPKRFDAVSGGFFYVTLSRIKSLVIVVPKGLSLFVYITTNLNRGGQTLN